MTMKRIYKLLVTAAAAITPLLTGCQVSPATAIEGEYALGDQSVQINGIIINLADWPGSSVTVTATNEDHAVIRIDSLLPGIDSFSMTAYVAKESGSKYRFYSSEPYYYSPDREIYISGNVRNGDITLSITDNRMSAVTGRWRPAYGSDGMIGMNLSFSSPLVTEITIGGITLPIEDAVPLINSLAKSVITPLTAELRQIELDHSGYVSISWNGDIDPMIEPLLSGVVQYWTEYDTQRLHLYLRKTITDGIGLSVSPAELVLTYSGTEDGSRLSIGLDRAAAAPIAELISSYLNSMTYEDYISAGSPLGEIDRDTFGQIQSTVTLLSAALAMPSTEFRLEFLLSRI